MTTADQVLIYILLAIAILFFTLLLASAVAVFKVVSIVKRVVAKAENIVDSVESATEVVRDASGPLAAFKVARNIMKIVNRSRR